jgi:glucose 1-dehydrogenase
MHGGVFVRRAAEGGTRMSKRLEGKIAVVTGSDSGIGQATAIAFAAEGASVAVNYLHDEEGANETKRGVEEHGGRAIVVQGDLSDEANVERLFRETVEQLGVPDILVNCAGIDSTGTKAAEMDSADWDREMKVNLYNPFYCSKHFIRERTRNGGRGKIINITSVHQTVPRAGAAGYDVAKGGLRNLTRTLALELAPDKINVNNIAPGMVLTPFNQQAIDDPEVREKQVQSIPWKRAAEPEEVGKLAVYLASEDADYVTGQTFTIDGGLMMNTGQGA